MTMTTNDKIAVLFSGGTDSTAAAALMLDRYNSVHLLTFTHSGITKKDNAAASAAALIRKYGAERCLHRMIDIDTFYKKITYHDYADSLIRYGLFNISTCGLCKMTMHMRTIIYCLDNGINAAADGANKNQAPFPFQMKEVIEDLTILYKKFGVEYSNPVFGYDFPDDIDWLHKLGISHKPGYGSDTDDTMTTGRLLYEKGIFAHKNIKGTGLDKTNQPECAQWILMNIFAVGYYIPVHGPDKYTEKTREFFRYKMEICENLIKKAVR